MSTTHDIVESIRELLYHDYDGALFSAMQKLLAEELLRRQVGERPSPIVQPPRPPVERRRPHQGVNSLSFSENN